ncbi:molybdopterin-dependent oxidoreductase [Baekduia sp. Peel2402]|uniref:molybdopterin-dependent oxidoreductase n=1 Tax=Baekduia sp. Peel2402 TaxID=3458296 RepID=UPI00403EEF43
MPLLPKDPPPGPSREDFWLSPVRGPWLTTILGSVLLVAVVIVGATGFLSHAAYNPDLGANAVVPRDHDLQLLIFDWPTRPVWLFALNQSLHTIVGIIAVPLLLAKLWSVIPKLFAWPPVASPAKALERLSLLGLVGGAIFQFGTGIFNAQLYYPWHFNFVVAHYYGAWVFLTALALHVAIKLPTMRRAIRERGALQPLIDGIAATEAEPYEAGGLAPPVPEPATISRRGVFALVGAASAGLFVVTAGQSIGGPLRSVALLAPRGRGTTFPVNKTARLARVTPAMVGAAWRLELTSGGDGGTAPLMLSRAALLAMDQHSHDLPIACVEGWTTTQRWTGVRLKDLAARAGAGKDMLLHVESLQPHGAFRQTTLSTDQWHDDQALLALQVNGADLPLDHGYPARIIVPALPGVHCTKWVGKLAFGAAA